MASNITLPKARSQANLIRPTIDVQDRGQSASAHLANIITAGIGQYAQSAEQAKTLEQQQQKDLVTAGAISDVNTMLAEREQAAIDSQNLQSLAVDVQRAEADGEISASDKELQMSFITQFELVKSAKSQGLLNDNAFSIRARDAKQTLITQYPSLAPQIDKIYNVATGSRSSTSTGKVAQEQLNFNRRMESKYGTNYSAEDVITESAKQRFAEDYELNKQLGSSNFGQVISATNSSLNLAIDSITLQASNIYSKKQAISQDEQDILNERILQSRQAYKKGIDKQVAEIRSRGGVVDEAAVRSQKNYGDQQFDDLLTSINDRDLSKQLEKRRQVQDLMWKNDMGGQLTKLNQVSSILGNGGLTSLGAFIGSTNPAQDQAVRSLMADSGISEDALLNTKQLVMDAAGRIANPDPVPGFEKLDAFYGIGAMKSGQTTDTVKMNTLYNIDKLVENPQDVSGAIKEVNQPKFARSIAEGSDETKNTFLQNVNGWEDKVFSDIQELGYNVSFDNRSQTLVVHKQEDVPAGERFGQGQSQLSTNGKRKKVNRGLTKTINDIFQLHRNTAYAGILQPSNKWLSDITNNFQPQPAAEAE